MFHVLPSGFDEPAAGSMIILVFFIPKWCFLHLCQIEQLNRRNDVRGWFPPFYLTHFYKKCRFVKPQSILYPTMACLSTEDGNINIEERVSGSGSCIFTANCTSWSCLSFLHSECPIPHFHFINLTMQGPCPYSANSTEDKHFQET